MNTQTHHWPDRIDVGPDAATINDPMALFTRQVADHLARRTGQPLAAVGFWRFAPTAPSALDGWTRHEITIDGHTVVITGTLDEWKLTQYRVTVDDHDAPYRYTLDRPLTEVLAEAAHQAITTPAA